MFKQNYGTLNPDWLFAACHYDHPPLTERLLNIQNVCKLYRDKSTVKLSSIEQPFIDKYEEDTSSSEGENERDYNSFELNNCHDLK